MKKDDISLLLQRYLNAQDTGKEPYFDADEIDELLENFEITNDYTYYDDLLELGLRLHPNNTSLKIRECKQLVFNESYDEALKLLENIGEANNEDLDVLWIECYCYTDQADKAIELAKKLISEDCEYVEAIFECIIPILNDLEWQQESREFLELGLSKFPDNQLLKNELCFLMEAEGDIPGAIAICNELIDKNPYSNDYWFTLGRLHSMVSDYDKAIEAFDFALTCDDSDPELKILRGYCLYMNENYEKALEAYKEVMDTHASQRVKPLMAECYVKLERFNEGYKLLKEIMKQHDAEKEPSVYVNYIRCCLELEKEKEASSTLKKTLKLYPDNTRILSLLALTYLENDHEQHALQITDHLFEAIDAIEEGSTKECDSFLRAGQYLYLKGDIEKALLYYKKILQRNPNMPHMNIHIAMAYLSLGNLKKFQQYYEHTSPQEMMVFLKNSGINMDQIDLNNPLINYHIPPEDLAKEFLNNKDNSN